MGLLAKTIAKKKVLSRLGMIEIDNLSRFSQSGSPFRITPHMQEQIVWSGQLLVYEDASEMLRRLQKSVGTSDRASRCVLLPLPPRLFPILAAPLLVLSPKAFEAVQRIGADLAGFTPAHAILHEPPRRFPVAPLNLG